MTDAPLEGGREQKDGGNERKSKEENQENKNYTRDCTEEEWDEELKSIYLLFFCCFLFSKSSLHVLQSKSCFFLFNSPSHTSHFLIFYFFLPFFYYYCFVFPFCNNISLREKKRKK